MSKKIAWQKYEDVIEKIKSLTSAMFKVSEDYDEDESVEEEFKSYDEFEKYKMKKDVTEMLPFISPEYVQELLMLHNFDCWLGHTNFNLTVKCKDELESIEGVEALNIISRYRFFIGIGKLFSFSNIRPEIETALCSSGLSDEFPKKLRDLSKRKQKGT